MKKNLLILTLLSSLLAFANGAYARGFDISLSQKTAQLHYLFGLGNLAGSGTDAALGLFYNNSDYLGKHPKAIVGHAKLLVAGNFKNMNQYFKLGVGAKIGGGSLGIKTTYNSLKIDDLGIAYLALGLRLAYLIPNSAMPMSIYTEDYYAPQITAFTNTKSMYELNAGFELEVTPAAKAYVGYRLYNIKFEDIDKSYNLDSSFHLGLIINF